MSHSIASIRFATADDLDNIMNVYVAAHIMREKMPKKLQKGYASRLMERFQKENQRALFENKNYHVLLAEAPHVVGYLGFKKRDDLGDISDFYTHPSQHHYGRQLMNHLADTAKDMGITRLEVCPSVFAAKHKIYEKFGFENGPVSAVLQMTL